MATTIRNEILKNKSEFNLEAAGVLVKNNYYASSIHCYYYASLQLMIHIILHKLTDNERISYNQQINTRGSHELTYDFISQKIDTQNLRNFRKSFTSLKDLRQLSDYKETEIRVDESDKAKEYATDLINFLKITFKI